MTESRPMLLDTGIPLDLEEPLLPPQEKEESSVQEVLSEDIVDGVHRYVFIMGWALGFQLQCLSLASTAILTIWYGDGAPPPVMGEASVASRFLYWFIFGLSNSWLVVFPVVCVAIERSWKDSGIESLQRTLLLSERPALTPQTRRMSFVAAVQFLVGIVWGCFMTWGLVDIFMGASLYMLATLACSMSICLLLCRGMIFIYDMFSETE